MIGDWVRTNLGHIIQVESITEDEINLEWNGNESYGGINIKEVESIPLTPEILKKNDFKYGNGYGYSFTNRKEMCGDGFEEEKVYINTDLNTLIIYTAASTVHLPVKCIHELQHALRLCGIEKEIEL